jgi:CheY-like chemotaxis protein
MKRETYSLLVLEDDMEAVQSLQRTIDEYNEDETGAANFQTCIARSGELAKAMLRERQIDCAILDLRVPDRLGGRDQEDTGNEVVCEILENIAIPLVVYIGHPEQIDPAIYNTPVNVLSKEVGNARIALDWLADHGRLMKALNEVQTIINKETARLFHKSLWPRWNQTKQQKHQLLPIPSEHVIARQIVAHLLEYFQTSLSVKSHTDEFYFIPSIRERLHTGDLVFIPDQNKDDGPKPNVYLVVTPQCDIANGYPEEILLARCDIVVEWDNVVNNIVSGGKKKSDKAMDRLVKWIRQNVALSQHFIPPCGAEGPWNVNFGALTTYPGEKADAMIKSRLASIAPQFLPNLMSRLAAHIGRYGQPELDADELVKYATHIFKIVEESRENDKNVQENYYHATVSL